MSLKGIPTGWKKQRILTLPKNFSKCLLWFDYLLTLTHSYVPSRCPCYRHKSRRKNPHGPPSSEWSMGVSMRTRRSWRISPWSAFTGDIWRTLNPMHLWAIAVWRVSRRGWYSHDDPSPDNVIPALLLPWRKGPIEKWIYFCPSHGRRHDQKTGKRNTLLWMVHSWCDRLRQHRDLSYESKSYRKTLLRRWRIVWYLRRFWTHFSRMHTHDLIEFLSEYDTILFVWGWSGGHIQPILNTVEHLRRRQIPLHALWIGGSHSPEENAALHAWIPFRSIQTLKLTTTRSLKVLLYPFIVVWGIIQSFSLIAHARRGKTCLFSKGGSSAAISTGIAAWILRVPLYIHESDMIPGRVNRLLGYFSTRIFLGFCEAKRYFPKERSVCTGQILHPIFSEKRTEGSFHGPIDWHTKLPHILVFCGSQGSRAIFETIIREWGHFPKAEWIVALGTLNREMKSAFLALNTWMRADEGWFIQGVEWLSQENVAHLITKTDIAITRWSATTLAELTFYDASPSKLGTHTPRLVIIPLPYSARNHQYENAKAYEKLGHTILEQKRIHQLPYLIATSLSS